MANLIALRHKAAITRRVLVACAFSTTAFTVVNCLNTKTGHPIPVVQVVEDEIEIRYGPPME